VAMLDIDYPGDFVVGTGEGHTVQELVSNAFRLVGLDWREHVDVDTTLVRRSESVPIVGDSSKLKAALGRGPEVKFDAVLRLLLAHDLRAFGQQVTFEVPEAYARGIGPASRGPTNPRRS